jgi:putative restriction endonuclease
MAKNWEYAAGITWGILVKAARDAHVLTYSDIAIAIDTNPLSVRMALEPIQDFCLKNRLPPLTAIVVGKNTKNPGNGFIAWDVDDLKTAHQIIFSYDWSKIINPYGSFGLKDTTAGYAQTILEQPERSKDVYSIVKVRGTAQIIFRAALLSAYRAKCAICSTSFVDILDGAHIESWSASSPQGRLSVNNGLLLCANHHRMFDRKIVTVTLSHKIHFSSSALNIHQNSVMDRAISADLHGTSIHLPANESHWPDIKYLKSHHEEMNWGYLP